MKKFVLIFVLLFCLGLPLVFVGCGEQEKLSQYRLVCTYDDATHTLSGSQSVDYVNKSDNMLSDIRFHLYPNAFRQDAKAKVVSATNRDKAYYNGLNYGGIDIMSVQIAGNDATFEIGGEDENILIVSLENGLYPDERVSIDIDFEVTLPNINHRFGYGESTVNFGNFYPIACVYEEGKGFAQDLYNSNGDPFYSDCSDYYVEITYPSKFTLASSGTQKALPADPQNKRTAITANKVRDFAFVLSDKFELATQSASGVSINYYFYDDPDPSQTMQAAGKAIKTFGELFGKYPYSQVSIVKSNFVHGGMEYPNMVLISDEVTDPTDYIYVVVHELAHQWWYGVVGNNENVGAWQDEGLTEYSTLLFFENNPEYGINYDNSVRALNTSYKRFVEIYSRYYEDLDTSMNRRLDQYQTEPEYTNCTYTKGALLFDSLRQSLGDKKFFKALRDYYKKYSFKNAQNADLVKVFIDSSGVDLEGFFDSWLGGDVLIL